MALYQPNLAGVTNTSAFSDPTYMYNVISLADMQKYGITRGFAEATSGGVSAGYANMHRDYAGMDLPSLLGFIRYLHDTTGKDINFAIGPTSRVVESMDPQVLNYLKQTMEQINGPQTWNLDFSPEKNVTTGLNVSDPRNAQAVQDYFGQNQTGEGSDPQFAAYTPNTTVNQMSGTVNGGGVTPDPTHPGSYLFNGRSYSSLSYAQAAADRAAAMSGATTQQGSGTTTQPTQQGGGSTIQSIQQQLSSGINAQTGLPLTQVQKNSLNAQLSALQGASTTQPSSTQTNTTSGAGPGGTGTTLNGSQADPAKIAAAMAVLNKYLNDGTIDSGTYQYFKKVVEAWNPANNVDYANILNTFETIKSTDIDPYYKELSRIFIDDLQASMKYLKDQYALDSDTNAAAAKKNIYESQQSLADRGMLFSGEAVKQLGTDAPFAQVGSPEALVSSIPDNEYAGLPLGTVQQGNKAASSSAALRYQNNLRDLQRQAEVYLGTTGAAGLIPEITPLGGITGDIINQQKVSAGNTLTSLFGQDQINLAANQPTQVFNQ